MSDQKHIKIAVAGASGFLGNELKMFFSNRNIDCVSLPRHLTSNPSQKQELAIMLSDCDAIVNLSGATIIQRHTKRSKQIIVQSRIETTRNLVIAMGSMQKKPSVFVSASAVGIYKPNLQHDENSSLFNDNWVGSLCKQWEEEALIAQESEIRTAIMRLGVVLGKNGGVLKKLYPLFSMGMGAVILPSSASFPWVHAHDVANFILFAISHSHVEGVYNLTANNHTNQKDFAKAFARALKRPLLMVVPGFFLKILYGKGAEIITKNAFVNPSRLVSHGFVFSYTNIKHTLHNEYAK